MTDAERIDAIEGRCRQDRRYPETLVGALVQYLKGQGTLVEARDAWQAAVRKKRYLYAPFMDLSDGEILDALDLRILDLCIMADAVPKPLHQLLQQSRFDQACDYLLKAGGDEQLIGWMMLLVEHAVDGQDQITRLGQRLLSYLPAQTERLLTGLRDQAEKPYRARLYPAFIKLLVKAQPPYLDLAWQIAQQREQPTSGAPRELPSSGATLGQCAKLLLEADPARFTAWARKIAGPESLGNAASRAFALTALMRQDPAQHIDLAVEATRAPLPKKPTYASASVQIAGLQTAIAFDPNTYWPLLEEAIVSRNYYLVGRALQLLAAADFDRARPTLQYCVANGDNVSAARALEGLLKQPWDEQEDYVLSLLAHRAKGVRERASTWLVGQGQAAIAGIRPYLTLRSADARLAAVRTLARIGGEYATALLAARLEPEKTLRVKEAILDAVGVPSAVFQGIRAHSPEAITAEAEATLRYVPKPALAWFSADETPALRWTTGAQVPPAVLSYLLYRQSRRQGKDLLAAQVHPVLALLDRSDSGDLALALYRGWVSRGAASSDSWLLPLVCALADDRLAARLRHQIETWGPGTRRTLAAEAVCAMALIESDAALDALNDLAKHFTRGSMKRVIKEAITVAAAR